MRRILQIFTALSIMSLLAYSCQKEREELPEPLKIMVETYKSCQCDPYIDQYLWKNKKTFISTCGGPACDCTVSYYDEKGVQFQMEPGYSFTNFRSESTFIRRAWTCKRE